MSEAAAAQSERPEAIHSIPIRHPGRWLATVFVVIIAAALADVLATNPNLQWGVVKEYFFSSEILKGLLLSLELTALAMTIGITLGAILAVMRQSTNPIVSIGAWLYVWFFRGTPVLVQLIFWFNLAFLFPRLILGIPFGGPTLVSWDTNAIITPLAAALLGLGLNEGAYMSEIVRAGILAVDPGQTEAARAFGMTRLQMMRRIILPQAMRIIVPPAGNETIGMLKLSSLASVITVQELLQSASIIYSRTFQTIPLLVVASLWYLIVTSILTFVQVHVERYFGRGATNRQATPTFLARLFQSLAGLVTRRPTFQAAPPAKPVHLERPSAAEPITEPAGISAAARPAPTVPLGLSRENKVAFSQSTQPMISAKRVWKSYGRTEVLKGVDLEVMPGQVVCIIGPSGAGKSTFLRCVNHLERIDRGTMHVEGRLMGYRLQDGKLHDLKETAICRQRAEIGMVFQHFNLWPHMTALQNVIEAPILVKRESRKDATERALLLLTRVGLGDKVNRYPRHLSGGEQQRVAIARALCMRPKLMLFDEPTSALDPEVVGEVLSVMADLAQQSITMIVVTHEIGFAGEAGDIIVFMDDGVVVEVGSPREVLANPRRERTRAFLSKVL